MFTVTKTAPNRVEITLAGTLDSDAMREALDELIAVSADMQNGLMLYRVTDFSMPTLGALAIELTRLPKLLALLGKYDRCAVLSDIGWLRTAAEIEGALIPGLEVKAFALDETEPAEEWLQRP